MSGDAGSPEVASRHSIAVAVVRAENIDIDSILPAALTSVSWLRLSSSSWKGESRGGLRVNGGLYGDPLTESQRSTA